MSIGAAVVHQPFQTVRGNGVEPIPIGCAEHIYGAIFDFALKFSRSSLSLNASLARL